MPDVDPDFVLKMYARGASIMAQMAAQGSVYFITKEGYLTGYVITSSGEEVAYDYPSFLDPYTLGKFVVRRPIVPAEMFAGRQAS